MSWYQYLDVLKEQQYEFNYYAEYPTVGLPELR